MARLWPRALVTFASCCHLVREHLGQSARDREKERRPQDIHNCHASPGNLVSVIPLVLRCSSQLVCRKICRSASMQIPCRLPVVTQYCCSGRTVAGTAALQKKCHESRVSLIRNCIEEICAFCQKWLKLWKKSCKLLPNSPEPWELVCLRNWSNAWKIPLWLIMDGSGAFFPFWCRTH